MWVLLQGNRLWFESSGMPWFIKTEAFTAETLQLPSDQRQEHIQTHRVWVEGCKRAGWKIVSGYLVDQQQRPGGGGLMFLQAPCFEDALQLIEQDPMIASGLVKWNLQEWIPVIGELMI